MNQRVLKRILLFVTLPLAVIAIALFVYADAYRTQPPNVSYNDGYEFAVEGQPVDAAIDPFPGTVGMNDSLIITLRLKAAPPGTPTSGLANETDGTLTPTLSGPDCSITPQGGVPATMSTAQTSLSAFTWTWSIDRCQTSGDKALLLSLKYDGNGPTSDPQPLKGIARVRVKEGPSLDAASRIAGIITGLLAALAPFVQLLVNRKSEKRT